MSQPSVESSSNPQSRVPVFSPRGPSEDKEVPGSRGRAGAAASGPSRTFAGSLLFSGTLHATLLGLGLTIPLAWTATRPVRRRATLWAAAPRVDELPLDDPIEPPFELELPPVEAEPELVQVRPEPEPFRDPELPGPAPDASLDPFDDRDLDVPLDLVLASSRPDEAPMEETPIAEQASLWEPQSDPAPDELPAEPIEATLTEVAPQVMAEHCPRPVYPARALRLGWQGTVVCSFVVARDGSVERLRVEQSSGHRILDDTVLRTLRSWRFVPGSRAGEPVEMELVRRFQFQLPP